MKDTSPCVKNGILCNNSGECHCGECICEKSKEFEYIGKHCQNAITSCDNYKDAVIYNAIMESPNLSWLDGIETETEREGEKKSKTAKKPSASRVEEIEKIYDFVPVSKISGKDANCRALLEDYASPELEDCWIQYSYDIVERSKLDDRTNETEITKFVRIEYETFDPTTHCPISISTGAVVGIIAGGIALIGIILLLIWKGIMMYLDMKEMKAFKQDIRNNRFWTEENPLYEGAATTQTNPLKNSAM